MATWPASLPQRPLRSGYGVNPTDMVVRTDMDGGNVRARRRSYARRDIVPVSWLMTRAQYQEFRLWFDDDAGAAAGSAWFTVTLATSGPLEPVSARFAGIWEATVTGARYWTVSGQLEVGGV